LTKKFAWEGREQLVFDGSNIAIKLRDLIICKHGYCDKELFAYYAYCVFKDAVEEFESR
jgi:hypothetical protein